MGLPATSRKLGVVLRHTGALEFGLHLEQRPKCREELIDQPTFAGERAKHGHYADLLCSKYAHHIEYSAEWRDLLHGEPIRRRCQWRLQPRAWADLYRICTGARRSPLLPLDHQQLLQAVDSLGQRVEPRWSYRQMYRHFEWDPLAQLSPSIDIYREQSARPRWPAFEIYRHPSSPRTVGDGIDTRSSRSGTRLRRAGIKRHRLLSRLTFQPAFLPSGASIKARSDVSIEA